MLRTFHSVCLVAITCGAVAALAQSPWDGTWKLNPAKSHMTGDTYTLTKSGNHYHYNGGTVQYDYACDGKEYPTIGGETITCKDTATTLDSTYKQNGKVDETIKRQVDPSGTSYTAVATYIRPDGGTTVTKNTFTRVGHGSGIGGTWKRVSTSTDHVGTFTIKVNGKSMHVESSEDRSTWDGKTDGTPSPVHGPDVPNGMTASEKFEGPNKAVSETWIGGKLVWHAEDTLTADHESYTEISWDPDKPNEKSIHVYEKQ